jgi:C4-dicarboxylate-specific signal transduction histidine kinase
MDLSPYLEALRRDLAAAAAPAGEQVAQTADLLSTALDASARLCLIEVLADATAEITTKLDGPTVEVRLRGREADLVVTHPQLKEAVERQATAEGVSVNQWLVRAAALALQGPPSPTRAHYGKSFTGFAQA